MLKLNIAFPALTTFETVLAPAAGAREPPDKAEAPARMISSTAIEPSIPNVYAELAAKLLKKAPVPPLVDEAIPIVSSNSVADSKSGAK